jgi:hypothetical protein
MRRVGSMDFERWKNFHANLKQIIESWKVRYGFLFLCYALLINEIALCRMSYQAVTSKRYATTTQARLRFARLRFAHSHFHFNVPLD